MRPERSFETHACNVAPDLRKSAKAPPKRLLARLFRRQIDAMPLWGEWAEVPESEKLSLSQRGWMVIAAMTISWMIVGIGIALAIILMAD